MATKLEMEMLSASVVAVSSQLPTALELKPSDLESALGASIEVRQGISPQGPTIGLSIRSRGIEMIISPQRVECSISGQEPSDSRSAFVAKALHVTSKSLGFSSWQALGYNYSVTFPAPNTMTAAAAIGAKVFSPRLIKRVLGERFARGAAWLYFDEADKAVTIRLEPRGGDRQATRIWAHANFHQDWTGDLPAEETIAGELGSLYESFRSLIGKILQ